MVFDDTVGLHHVEFHTTDPQHLLNIFINTYGFSLSAVKTTSDYRQWLLNSHQCRLIISSTSDTMPKIEKGVKNEHYDILTTLLANETTRSLFVNRKTVFNLALSVNCVQSVLDRNPDAQVLVSRRQAVDEHGSIDYACIKSSVGNVVHTLINMSNYSGPYLPGFMPVTEASHQRKEHNEGIVSIIDHIAIAVPRGSAQAVINWFERVLGLTRFAINREDDPFQGFAVRVGSMGMRMFAGLYWKCSETGCADATKKFKIVVVESLILGDSNATDQITTFIKNHDDQGGIQHLAFSCVDNIKRAVRTTKEHGAEFLTPCPDYYAQENNGAVIEAAGESASELGELGILLDDEADGGNIQDNNPSTTTKTKRVLLQIFTTSLFDNNTFFLELIERRGANGFGSGNVRTLWKIVQKQMDRDI